MEERKTLFFTPRGEVLSVGNVGRFQKLSHRKIVGVAILPDIELGEMKAEDVQDTQHRPDCFANEALAPDFSETFLQDGEVGGYLFRATIARTGLGDPCTVCGTDLQWETSLDEQYQLAPWLAGIAGRDLFAQRTKLPAEHRDPVE